MEIRNINKAMLRIGANQMTLLIAIRGDIERLPVVFEKIRKTTRNFFAKEIHPKIIRQKIRDINYVQIGEEIASVEQNLEDEVKEPALPYPSGS